MDIFSSVQFSFGEGNGNPLQYSCLENSMDRGAWRATVLGIAESDTTVPLTLRNEQGKSTATEKKRQIH